MIQHWLKPQAHAQENDQSVLALKKNQNTSVWTFRTVCRLNIRFSNPFLTISRDSSHRLPITQVGIKILTLEFGHSAITMGEQQNKMKR